MYLATQTGPARRRAVILLVVITLLSLFAVVGLTFVLYASAEATNSRIYREAQDDGFQTIAVPQQQPGSPPPPDVPSIQSFALGELIYDVGDDSNYGIYSAIRGHSLARAMYGWDYTYAGNNLLTPINVLTDQSGNPTYYYNTTPYNGVGRLTAVAPGSQLAAGAVKGINYTYFSADGTLYDPERLPRTTSGAAPGAYTGGQNAPYTYPDHNNMYLAAVQAGSTGPNVLQPSFHRHWMFNPGQQLNDLTNPNWTNTAGKYLTLRPRPVDNVASDGTTSFPYPSDATGDVKNLSWAPGGNDSIWIDMNYPVRTWPDGRKYKPLFAWLVRDLDGLVNLNAHGNVHYTDPTTGQDFHQSNQGWAKTEVNLGRVLAANVPATGAPEWTQLFRFTPAKTDGTDQLTRYGYWNQVVGMPPPGPTPQGSQQPDTGGSLSDVPNRAPVPRSAPFYSLLDYDGHSSADPADAMLLPGLGANANFSAFPLFPSARWGNGNGTELTNHPALYNYFLLGSTAQNVNYVPPYQYPPGGLDRIFGPSELQSLLAKWNAATDPVPSTDLATLLPNNFYDVNNPTLAQKRRWLVTTHSMDIDRPGVTPFVWNPYDTTKDATTGIGPGYRQFADPATGNLHKYPLAASLNFPALANRTTVNVPGGSEFSLNSPGSTGATAPTDPRVEWRAINAMRLGRVDLNRPLRDYPPTSNGVFDLTNSAVVTAYNNAVADRQQLAKDVFDRLRYAVGAMEPADAAGNSANADQFRALRYLAQLAVNIVDYVDSDDVMTPFNWYGTEWVMGFELPRVVINETYMEVQNDPSDPGLTANPKKATTNYLVKVWAELLNPLRTDTNNLSNGGTAQLVIGTTPVYQLLLTNSNRSAAGVDYLRDPANLRGDPAAQLPNPPPANVGKVIATEQGWGTMAATQTIAPNDMNYAGTGFYLMGPEGIPGTGANGNVTNTLTTSSLVYSVPVNQVAAGAVPPAPSLLLRRLACPYLPPQADPTKSFYNPYVTVDYAEADRNGSGAPEMNDATDFTVNGANANKVAVQNRSAFGRNQPYAAEYTQWVQQAPANPYPTRPQHTLLRHNGVESAGPPAPGPTQTLNLPFNWLVHLDRQVISPIEVMHTSGFHPHEVTQQFYSTPEGGGLSPYQHVAPWWQYPNLPSGHAEAARLYRALEFFEAHDRCAGMTAGGRLPGKININTIFDKETFDALCDANKGNGFNQANVNTAWTALLNSRTPGLTNAVPTPSNAFSASDVPFRGLGTGSVPTGDAQFAAGLGLKDTVLRPALKVGINSSHPYQQLELLTKIYNQTTTRSNLFAVWCTVGYFEVDATNGKLKAEILPSGSTRPQFFTIVDRTNLTQDPVNSRVQGPKPFFFECNTAVAAGQVTIPVPSATGFTPRGNPPATPAGPAYLYGAAEGDAWMTTALNSPPSTTSTAPFTGIRERFQPGGGAPVQPGSTLILDVGQDPANPAQSLQETVEVQSIDTTVTPPTITVSVAKAHAAGFLITNARLGNPGPQSAPYGNFSYTQAPWSGTTVRYFLQMN
jgi:hypothetical protein